MGEKPTNCDICRRAIKKRFIDGRTKMGGLWAILCPSCHVSHGCGLGLGKGQKYELTGADFVKVEG